MQTFTKIFTDRTDTHDTAQTLTRRTNASPLKKLRRKLHRRAENRDARCLPKRQKHARSQTLYSVFYTLIEYSLFQFLLNIALRLDGYRFLNSANIGHFLITLPAIVMILILFLVSCMLTYLNACILLGGFQASMARQKLRMKDIFLHGCARCFKRFRLNQLFLALPLFAYQILVNLFFFHEICFHITPYNTVFPALFSKLLYAIPIIAALILIGIFAIREFSASVTGI